MRVGGAPSALFRAGSADDLIELAHELHARPEPLLVLGGGSNLVVADDISNWNVLKVENMGLEWLGSEGGGKTVVRAQAGEDWDAFVAAAVSRGLAGMEAMSGIPGTIGASPIQNIGAYGQELSSTMTRLQFFDFETGRAVVLERQDLGFGYRDSVIKRGRSGVVVWVEFELLDNGGASVPIASEQIAGALGVKFGDSAPLTEVRDAVLKLRRAKGMLLDAGDPDTVSCGSFFTNPLVSDRFARTLPSEAPRWESEADDGLTVKLSAAWLIEAAGITKGFSLPGSRAAVSSKHALAITNRGGATASEIAELARFIQERVAARWGINLAPEPNLIGFDS